MNPLQSTNPDYNSQNSNVICRTNKQKSTEPAHKPRRKTTDLKSRIQSALHKCDQSLGTSVFFFHSLFFFSLNSSYIQWFLFCLNPESRIILNLLTSFTFWLNCTRNISCEVSACRIIHNFHRHDPGVIVEENKPKNLFTNLR